MLLQLYIQLGRSTKVLGNIKIPSPLSFTFIEDLQSGFNSPTPVELLHSLKIFNKGLMMMMMVMMVMMVMMMMMMMVMMVMMVMMMMMMVMMMMMMVMMVMMVMMMMMMMTTTQSSKKKLQKAEIGEHPTDHASIPKDP